MASVQANGITIEYEEQGSGEPLLLVMGLGGQLIDWPPDLIQLLVDNGFRVIWFDNRDSGLSTELVDQAPPTRRQLAKTLIFRRPLDAPYLLHDMAADAVGLLDALDIDRAHVVGMSMGGMIAQQMAIDHPDRVSSLTSIMSTTGIPKVGRPKARCSCGVCGVPSRPPRRRSIRAWSCSATSPGRRSTSRSSGSCSRPTSNGAGDRTAPLATSRRSSPAATAPKRCVGSRCRRS